MNETEKTVVLTNREGEEIHRITERIPEGQRPADVYFYGAAPYVLVSGGEEDVLEYRYAIVRYL